MKKPACCKTVIQQTKYHENSIFHFALDPSSCRCASSLKSAKIKSHLQMERHFHLAAKLGEGSCAGAVTFLSSIENDILNEIEILIFLMGFLYKSRQLLDSARSCHCCHIFYVWKWRFFISKQSTNSIFTATWWWWCWNWLISYIGHKAESYAIFHCRKGGWPYSEQIRIHSRHECVTLETAVNLCHVDSITERRIHGFTALHCIVFHKSDNKKLLKMSLQCSD